MAGEVRVGVDIGGTFTDTVLEAEDRLFSTKVLTDYEAPERAIVKGVQEVVALAGLSAGDVTMVIHGTTLVTNALIERRGARTAFITTEGFRDVVEMRRENRFEQYDLNVVLPTPLIARKDRYVIAERLDWRGTILKPIDQDELDGLVQRICQGGYESVAIGLMHAYANGVHERRIAEALKKARPELALSLSSEVAPQIREFERFNTVCANAYVKPLVASYLPHVAARLSDIGVTCPVFMMLSGGGLVSLADAAEFPVRLLESGPAGGAIYAARYALTHGMDRVVSYDMGGTTAKICLVEDMEPKTTDTFEVARTYRFKKGSGTPVSIPVIEMVEIGAGGGSVAYVDELRQIRVGPESVGSTPGPACYAQGGDRPAVTDANLVLGRLDPDNFAGGKLRLSVDKAQAAIAAHIRQHLDMDDRAAAFGICETVEENMSNAARAHAVENGRDLSNFTMIAFGGGAPIHAARLCEKLGIDRLLIPPGAGVGSAIGFLAAPFGYETVRSARSRLEEIQPARALALLGEMKQEAHAFVERGKKGAPVTYRMRAFMRYVGQGWEIPVEIVDTAETLRAEHLKADFEAAYRGLFGQIIEQQPIEVVSWVVRANTPLREHRPLGSVPAPQPARVAGTRQVFDARLRTVVEARVVERSAMAPGETVDGPAVIVEAETSTLVPSSFHATMCTDRALLLVRRRAQSAAQQEKRT